MKTDKLTLILVGTFLLAACGGGGENPNPPDPPGPSINPISSLDDAQSATVRIVVEGNFVYPDGEYLGEGSGSGFLIDPSGLVVTNNHVVTGAATIQAHVPGESKPRFAKVVGYSECSDLAVIDIDGEDFSFLAWFEGEADVGMDVFALGYPLGDPDFTMTKGIISKAESSSVSAMTGPQSVMEHDAKLQPGNSGGPLVNEAGQVVGINFLASTAGLEPQYYAIALDEAIPTVGELKKGVNLYSIGINGAAVEFTDGTTGIWAIGIESGSPASKAGLKAGDVIMALEGLPLGKDGRADDYCDILKSNDLADPLKVEVYRYSTGETLEGEINGRELEVVSDPEPAPANGDQVITGTLTVSDAILDDGSYYDPYSFTANAGDVVDILLESEDFDSYLGVLDTNTELLAEDDDSGGSSNSYVSLTIMETGTYTIFATSYNSGATGDYTLMIDFN